MLFESMNQCVTILLHFRPVGGLKTKQLYGERPANPFALAS